MVGPPPSTWAVDPAAAGHEPARLGVLTDERAAEVAEPVVLPHDASVPLEEQRGQS